MYNKNSLRWGFNLPVMKYVKETEEQKKREKYFRWNEKRIGKAKENMNKSIKQILCQRMNNCRNKDTQKCFQCTSNKTRLVNVQAVDYYSPKVEGLKYF